MARATHEPEMPFARYRRSSKRRTLGVRVTVVVISGDGELLTSVPNSVAGEMLLVHTTLTIGVTLMIY